MTVLESPEGFLKSSALAELYGPEFFSDQSILGLDDKHLQETVRGRWCIECADLSGLRKADVEKIKAQLSRFEDRTRPAYGRAVIDAPRSCVFWGTTNEVEYLRSQTGNRRFLPVPVGRVDIEGLRRDRDQLWAEAMACEPLVKDLSLPESLWAAAGVEQDKRTKADVWHDALANVSEAGADYEEHKAPRAPVEYEVRPDHKRGDVEVERVTSRWLLTDVLAVPIWQQAPEHSARLGTVMRSLGWRGPEKTMWIGGRAARGYERDVTEREPWE